MGLLEDMQRLQESLNISKQLLHANKDSFTALHQNNIFFQQVLDSAVDNNQKLINIFERLEGRLEPEEAADLIAAAKQITRTNEVLVGIFKNNQAIAGQMGETITGVSQQILALTKAGEQ